MGSMIQVGAEYPLFKELNKKMRFQDGGVLEAMKDGDGLWYNMYLNMPTGEEIALFQRETIQVKLVLEDDLVLPLIRFGNSTMIFEMSFDPTAYNDQRALQIRKDNNLLTVVLVDSSSSVVKGLRNANLPLDFIRICYKIWEQAFTIPGYSEKYKTWYQGLQQTPLDILWDNAKQVGVLGESYDLSDIEKM